MTITYSEVMFVALGIQHKMRMRHGVLCVLFGSTVFFKIMSLALRFSKKKLQ